MNYRKLAHDAIEDHRLNCLDCCGRSRTVAADCTQDKCRSFKWRNYFIQTEAFGAEYKKDFFKNASIVLDSYSTGKFFTINGLKRDFVSRYNGSSGPVHPNWWGCLTHTQDFKSKCKFVKVVKSTNEKSNGGYTGLWEKVGAGSMITHRAGLIHDRPATEQTRPAPDLCPECGNTLEDNHCSNCSPKGV